MVQLSDAHIDTILERIQKDGVSDARLQNDLLDHYCCFIEHAMDRGENFDGAYAKAFTAITPNGMHEIEEELFFLLTFKIQTNMKRIIYGFGFFAAFLISSGLLFRTLHWPFAALVLECGYTSLLIAVLAIFINALKYLKIHSGAYNVRFVAGLLAGIFIASGNLFKLNAVAGADLQILIGMFILNFLFMPLFFYHLYKQSLAKT